MDPTTLQILLSAALGLGLAAACGFRIFVPLLVAGSASAAGYLQLSSSFDWLASTPALIILSVATGLEIAAYFVPWVDNLLDTIGGPAAVVAGTVVAASAVVGMDPMLQWAMAAIAGGGAAGTVHGVMALARGTSTVTTGGLANPFFSAVETGGAFFVSLLAILVPLAAVAVVAIALYFGAMALRRMRARPVAAQA